MLPDLLTTTEVAKIMGISTDALVSRERRGKLPFKTIRMGYNQRTIRYLKDDVLTSLNDTRS